MLTLVVRDMQKDKPTLLSFPRLQGHNPWLDLLRTLAVLLVLLRHGTRHEASGLSGGVVANLFGNGWVGVDLFFVLSGYLIASGLIRRSEGNDRLFPKGYFRDRILRIVPAYYAMLGLCAVGFFPGSNPASAESFVAHLLFLQDYTGSDINVVFWSLGVEEKFYLLAPAIVLILSRQTRVRTFAAICFALLLISPLCRGLVFEASSQPIQYEAFFNEMRSPFHMSLEGFVVGIGVAILRANVIGLAQRWALAGLGGGMVALVACLGSHDFLGAITRADAWLVPTLLAILFGTMVFCAACLAECELRFEPFFRFNARLSYCLYLVHFPLLPLAIALSGEQDPVIFWLAYLVLSYVAALAIHFGVEKPFLMLKQSLSREGPRIARAKPVGAIPS